MSATADVVVVGAGPVGLLLAGELRLRGVDVLVLERLTAPTGESRATHLHARTMELLGRRGLLDALGGGDARDIPSDPVGHFGGLRLRLDGTGSPWAGQWRIPQSRTEAVLGAWATGLGARVLRGTEVTGLRDDGGQVRVSAGAHEFTAGWVAGCDGEDSAVRALAGISLAGEPSDRLLLRADIRGITLRPRRFERLPGGLATAADRDDGTYRLMVHDRSAAPGDGPATFADVVTAWRNVTGEDISGAEPLWVNAFGNASQLATGYRQGRVLLAGDAAHRQMPVGGQAINIGLQDAFDLGEALGRVASGQGPEGLLDDYGARRRAAGREALADIRAQAQLLMGGAELDPLRTVLGDLLAVEPVRRGLARRLTGLETVVPQSV
jgi:bifunctional oxygenase/reductase